MLPVLVDLYNVWFFVAALSLLFVPRSPALQKRPEQKEGVVIRPPYLLPLTSVFCAAGLPGESVPFLSLTVTFSQTVATVCNVAPLAVFSGLGPKLSLTPTVRRRLTLALLSPSPTPSKTAPSEITSYVSQILDGSLRAPPGPNKE